MVLITGASGFLGTQLQAVLSADGVPYKAVGHTYIPSVQSRELRAIESIIHLAGMAHRTGRHAGSAEDYYSANVALPLDLARKASRAGVRRFIFVSTAKVNGETSTHGLFAPGDAANPQGDYAISKWQAEQFLNQELRGTKTRLIVVRPPLVYGPKVKGNLRTLLGWLQKGLPMPFGAANAKRSMVSSTNLSALLLHLSQCPLRSIEKSIEKSIKKIGDSSGRTGEADGYPVFFPSDLDIDTASLIRRMAEHLGRRARLLSVPSVLFRWTPFYERIFLPFQVDSTFAQAIGWKNRLSPDDALRVMVEDYLHSRQ